MKYFDFSSAYEAVYSGWQNAINRISVFFSYKFIKAYLAGLGLLNLILWAVAFKIHGSLSQDLIVLHYNVNFGIDLIGSNGKIYILPFLGFFIWIINLIFSAFLLKSRHFRISAHLFLASALLSHFFLLLALASIYLINFR